MIVSVLVCLGHVVVVTFSRTALAHPLLTSNNPLDHFDGDVEDGEHLASWFHPVDPSLYDMSQILSRAPGPSQQTGDFDRFMGSSASNEKENLDWDIYTHQWHSINTPNSHHQTSGSNTKSNSRTLSEFNYFGAFHNPVQGHHLKGIHEHFLKNNHVGTFLVPIEPENIQPRIPFDIENWELVRNIQNVFRIAQQPSQPPKLIHVPITVPVLDTEVRTTIYMKTNGYREAYISPLRKVNPPDIKHIIIQKMTHLASMMCEFQSAILVFWKLAYRVSEINNKLPQWLDQQVTRPDEGFPVIGTISVGADVEEIRFGKLQQKIISYLQSDTGSEQMLWLVTHMVALFLKFKNEELWQVILGRIRAVNEISQLSTSLKEEDLVKQYLILHREYLTLNMLMTSEKNLQRRRKLKQTLKSFD